ncbi:MAG: amino acid ABC transporter permease [Actinomycetota bacterium]
MQPSSAPAPLPLPAARPRRGRGERRAIWIAAVSTVLVLGVIAAVAITAPGSKQVQEAFFSPRHLRGALLGTDKTSAVPVAFFSVTVRLFLVSEALVLVFGLVLAVIRSLPGPALFPFRFLSIAYIDFFRGIPLLLLMFIVGFGFPGMRLGFLSRQSQFTYGVISLTLVYSAYVAEVYRAGIESVHESQTSAARSLGLSRGQALRYVILPQAIRRVMPPLLNDFIGLQKDTALVAAIGLVEVVRTAQAYGTTFFNFAGLTIAAGLFVLITIPLARVTDYLMARDQRKMRAAGGVR